MTSDRKQVESRRTGEQKKENQDDKSTSTKGTFMKRSVFRPDFSAGHSDTGLQIDVVLLP